MQWQNSLHQSFNNERHSLLENGLRPLASSMFRVYCVLKSCETMLKKISKYCQNCLETIILHTIFSKWAAIFPKNYSTVFLRFFFFLFIFFKKGDFFAGSNTSEKHHQLFFRARKMQKKRAKELPFCSNDRDFIKK